MGVHHLSFMSCTGIPVHSADEVQIFRGLAAKDMLMEEVFKAQAATLCMHAAVMKLSL